LVCKKNAIFGPEMAEKSDHNIGPSWYLVAVMLRRVVVLGGLDPVDLRVDDRPDGAAVASRLRFGWIRYLRLKKGCNP
jgi:hypothetical protein